MCLLSQNAHGTFLCLNGFLLSPKYHLVNAFSSINLHINQYYFREILRHWLDLIFLSLSLSIFYSSGFYQHSINFLILSSYHYILITNELITFRIKFSTLHHSLIQVSVLFIKSYSLHSLVSHWSLYVMYLVKMMHVNCKMKLQIL